MRAVFAILVLGFVVSPQYQTFAQTTIINPYLIIGDSYNLRIFVTRQDTPGRKSITIRWFNIQTLSPSYVNIAAPFGRRSGCQLANSNFGDPNAIHFECQSFDALEEFFDTIRANFSDPFVEKELEYVRKDIAGLSKRHEEATAALLKKIGALPSTLLLDDNFYQLLKERLIQDLKKELAAEPRKP